MPIYLKTNDGNIALKTGGVPQSQINDLLAAQEARLEAEHAEEIENINEIHEAEVDGLNTTITGLETEIDKLEEDVEELQAIVAEMPTPVEGVEF